MAVAYAPFDENSEAPARPLKLLNKETVLPVSDNTECNYLVMGFVVGVFLLGLVDSMRGK
jgi:hypothetical protein